MRWLSQRSTVRYPSSSSKSTSNFHLTSCVAPSELCRNLRAVGLHYSCQELPRFMFQAVQVTKSLSNCAISLAVSKAFLSGSTPQSSLGCRTRAAELKSCTSMPCTCLTRRWQVLQLPLLAWLAGTSRILVNRLSVAGHLRSSGRLLSRVDCLLWQSILLPPISVSRRERPNREAHSCPLQCCDAICNQICTT